MHLSTFKRIVLLAFCGAVVAALVSLRGRDVHGQSSPTPATIMAGMGTPASNGIACNIGVASSSTAMLYNQRDVTTGNSIWKCALGTDGVTYAWQAPFSSGTPFQNQDFTLQPGLFATNAAKSNVYYEVNAVNILALTTREEGSPICTAAPVLVLLDLGTSPSTVYASATVLYSQTLSTSNTVASNTGLSVPIAAGHYLGIGFSAGTCVTPPTISASVTLQ